MRAVAFRLRFRTVQTAIIEMYNPQTESTITLFAMAHQADAGYFKNMEAAVNELTGFDVTVLQESFSIDFDTVDRELLDDWFGHLAKESYEDGRGGQSYHFAPLDTEVCDLPLSGNSRKTRAVLRFIAKAAAQAAEKESSFQKALGTLLMVWLGTAMEKFHTPYKFLVAERNRHVLGVVARRLTDEPQDLGIIYGAMHMNGITRGLRKLGYKQRRIEWLNAHSL